MADSTDGIGPAQTYTTIAAWETARDGETGIQTGQLVGGFDGGSVAFAGVVGTMILEAAAGAEHPGYLPSATFDTDWAHIDMTGIDAGDVDIDADKIKIRGIAFRQTATLANDARCIRMDNNASQFTVNSCLFFMNCNQANFRLLCISTPAGGANGNRITNNAIYYNCTNQHTTTNDAIDVAGSTWVDEVSHNTIVNVNNDEGRGIRNNTTAAIVNLYNNAVFGMADACISIGGTLFNRGGNATSDTSGDTGFKSLTVGDELYDYSNGDIRPLEGSTIDQAGENRTAQTDLDVDIVGETRSTTPNIGAHELYGAAGGGGRTFPIYCPGVF